MSENIFDFYENYLTNPIWSWIWVLLFSGLITVVAKVLLKSSTVHLKAYAEKTESIWDDFAVDIIAKLKPIVIFVWVFFLLSKSLNSSSFFMQALQALVVILTMVQIGLWGHHLMRSWRNLVLDKRIQEDPSSAPALGLLYTILEIILIVTIVLIGLSNMGVNIGALLAGLGVGGIAVALAAQNILGDLLASLSIILDKPFVVGDSIVAGTDRGTIENIGIKTTRVRSVSGEQLIFSNKDLLESRIRNYKRMEKRRGLHRVGVTYSTSRQTLEQIPGWIKNIITKYDDVELDYCNLVEFAPSSVDFEFAFYVKDRDYNNFLNYQQKILLDIFNKFDQENVSFAFPSQSIYVEKLSSPKA